MAPGATGGSRHRTAALCRSAWQESSPQGYVLLPRRGQAHTAKTQQVKKRESSGVCRLAAAVPFWQEVSVVAAAVEVGTAPLAQVDTFLLWKTAGAAGCQHICTSMPRAAQKLLVPGLGPSRSLGEGFGVHAAKWQGSWPWHSPGLEA